MSIQNTINKALSVEGQGLRHITSIGGDGDVDLPDNCYLLLRGSKAKKVSIGTNCTVVFEQASISDVVTIGAGCTITMDRSTFLKKITATQSKLTMNACSTQDQMHLSGCSMDSYLNSRRGGSFSILADEGSKLSLRAESFLGDNGIQVLGNSQVSLWNPNFRNQFTCIYVDNAELEMLGGVLTSQEETCVKTFNFAKISISALASGSAKVSFCEQDSTSSARMITLGPINSENFGFTVDNGSTLDLLNTNVIKAKILPFRILNAGIATLSKIPKITSETKQAIYMKGGILQGRDIGTIESALETFLTLDGSEIRIFTLGEIHSTGEVAISTVGDNYELTNVGLIRSDAKDTLVAGEGTRVVLRNVKLLESVAQRAMVFDNTCQLEMYNVVSITSKKDGIVMGDNASVIFSKVQSIASQKGQAVSFGKKAIFRATETGTIDGAAGAILVGKESFAEIVVFDTLSASKEGTALELDSSRLVLREGKEISSVKGAGLVMKGSAGILEMRKIAKVESGPGGKAISLTNVFATIVDCTLLHADDVALYMTDGSVASLLTLPKITSDKQQAIFVEKGSKLETRDVGLIEAVKVEAVHCEGSEIIIHTTQQITGAPDEAAVVIKDSSKVLIENISKKILGDVTSDNACELSLLSVIVDGKLDATDTTTTLERATIKKKVTLTKGISKIEDTLWSGSDDDNLVTDNSMSAIRLTTKKDIIFLKTGFIGLSCVSPNYKVTTSSLLMSGCQANIDWTSGVVIDCQIGGLLQINASQAKVKCAGFSVV